MFLELTNTRLAGMVCVFVLGFFARAASAYDLVVAQDGSGNFTTVQAAFDVVPDQQQETTRIYVKAGTYRQKVTLAATKWNVELIGEDAASTILTWDDYGGMPDTEFYTEGVSSTASTSINARNFTARNLTFANSHGAGSQATALVAAGNRGRFFDCRFLAFQDTLQTTGRKQYFKRCYIEGAVDFIFGSSTAVFAHCAIFCTASGCITAADTPSTRKYGYVFRDCEITGTAPKGSVVLGRSWGTAKTVFFRCELGALIDPAGWIDNIDAGDAGGAVLYAEYENTGTGAQPADRVAWSIQLSDDAAADYSLKKIFDVQSSAGTRINAVGKPWYNESD